MKVKLLYMVVASKHYTGGHQMAINLLNGLKKHGDYECHMLVTDKKTDVAFHAGECGIPVKEIPYPEPLEKFGGELFSLKNSIGAIPSFIKYRGQVRRHIENEKFDVVIAGNIRALLPVIFFRGRSFKLIWNIFLGNTSRGIWCLINQIGLQASDAVFFEYEKQASDIFTKNQVKKYIGKFSTHYTYVDQLPVSDKRPPQHEKNEKFRIGFAATLSERKGFDTVYNIASRLKDFDFEFLIAGDAVTEKDAEFSEPIIKRAKEENLPLVFLGWQKSMKTFWESIDIFLLPSRNEGVPVVIREAMRECIPIVASDIGGVAEAVGWGNGAILVEKNDVDGYCDAILTLFNDSDKRKVIADYSKKRFHDIFTSETYIKSVDKEIKRILK